MNKKSIWIISGIFFLMLSSVFAGGLFGGKKQLSLNNIFNQNSRFTENKGQLSHYKIDWAQCGTIGFYTQSFGGTAYFADNGIGFGFVRESLDETRHPSKYKGEEEEEEEEENHILNTTGFFLEFVGKNQNSTLIGLGKQITQFNYYKGSSHITGVGNYDELLYQNLYNNIDLKYSMANGKLKFDYLVKVGAEVSQIQLRYNGMKNVSINKNGELEILTEWGKLMDAKPYSYQIIDGKEVAVDVAYVKYANGNIGFEIRGNYDATKTLVIDPPTLTWATLVGATNGDGYLFDVTVDTQGNSYGTGWYNQGFPTVNPVDVTFPGGDAIVFKLASDGKTLLYSTWIGGDGQETGTGVAVNTLGQAFVCGFTNNATNFPAAGTPVQSVLKGGNDIFALRFGAAGTLVYSTFYGGTGEDQAFAIDIDASNNAFITGYTASTNGFATAGAYQTVHAGAFDAFVLKLNPTGSSALFCTYYGGTGNDLGRDIVVDGAGNPYFGGGTTSTTSIASGGSFDATYGGGAVDGFVVKLSANGTSRVYGAYCGGTNEDKVEALDVKCNGELVMSGYTRSDNVSFVAVNAIQANNGAPGGGPRDAFMRRVNPAGSALLNSTFMGSNGEDAVKNGDPFGVTVQQRGTGVSVNRLGNIAVCMCTSSTGLPLVSPTQAVYGGGLAGLGDAYIFVTDSTGTSIVFSTYFGGDGDDYPVSGIKYHPVDNNVFVVAGNSHSSDGTFPATAGSFMTTRQTALTSDQPYVVKYTQVLCKIDVQLPTPAAVCKGDTIKFSADTLCGGSTPTFKWTVNGVVQVGETSKKFSSNKLNNNDVVCVIFSKIIPGCYPVTEADTACVTVTVNPLPVMTLADDSICAGKSAVIDAGAGFASYLWSDASTASSISKSVAGSYWVEVTKNGCKKRDTMNLVLRTSLSILPDSAKTCNGTNSGYVVTFKISGGDPASYKVTGLAGTLTGNAFTSNLIASGNSFSLIVTDKYNCDTVKFNGTLSCGCNPTVTISSDKLICKGDSVPLTFSLSGAVPPYDVVYTDGTSNFTLTGISNGFVKYVHPLDTTVYTAVSITDKNGCTALSSSAVTITTAPVFQILVTPSHVTCFGLCNGSAAALVNNGAGPYTYLWSPAPPQGQGTANVSQMCAGTYKVIITDKYGCKDSVSPVLTEPQKLIYAMDSTSAHCNHFDGSTGITVVSGGSAPFDYQWDLSTGGQATAVAANLQPGKYTVVLTDNKNCVVTDSVTVLNIAAPSFSSAVTQPLCSLACNGTAVLTNITGGTRPFTYVWKSPVGVIPIVVDSSASALCAGTYKVVVTDKFSCKDSASFILSDPSAVQISITPSSKTCVNGSLQLTALASGGTPNYSYSWLADPTLSSTVIANPVATPVGIKKYTVSATDVNNCPPATASVTLIKNPVADFIFDSVPDCNAITVDFTNQSTASTINHSCDWDFDNGSTSAICDPQFVFNEGTYAITLTVRDDSSCVQSVTKNIDLHIYDAPFAAFQATPQPTTIYDPSVSFINLSTGATSYSWHFGTGDSSKLINPYYTFSDTGTFNVCLRAINSAGCYNDTCSDIRIDPVVSFYVANAFTPNGDGKNEEFIPFASGYDIDDYELLIFDRWGELIFKSNSLSHGWDGTYKGHPVQMDVYVWKVAAREQYSKKTLSKIGRVSLIR
jgi:gliding motility-associated-like protein